MAYSPSSYDAVRDGNRIPVAMGVSNIDATQSLPFLIDPVTGRVLVDSGGGGSFTLLTPTGTVNGTNTTFVFTSAPSVIALDNGSIMNKVSSDSTVNWTGTTTVVLTQAPNFNIFGF